MELSAGDLRNRVELLQRVEKTNEFEETTYDYVPYDPPRKAWSQIVPLSGRQETLPGEVDRMVVTHRVTVRRSSFRDLTTDMRLRYRGQDYQVIYAYPNYRQNAWTEIYCKLVVEDGVQSF